MAEIYKDQTSPIKTKIFWGGELVDADGPVTAVVYDITEDNTIYPAVNPNVPVGTFTATKLETDMGTYQVVLPLALCRRNRKFKVEWRYTVNNNQGSHIYFTDVVTPYANLSDIIDDLNFGTDPSDPNYKSYHDLQMAEKYARKLIEIYTNQVFHLYDDKQIVYGSGSDILPMPFKLNEIHEVYENDVLLIDNINNVKNWIYVPMISESGFGIRVNRQQLMDDMIYSANGMVQPTINDQGFSAAFRKDRRYSVQGRFGWSSIPDNVEEACIILIKQYFDQDRAWKDKYVKNISTFDWKFEFLQDAHKGTGNLYADQLLSPYVLNGMVAF
jgi:hypothetical protein